MKTDCELFCVAFTKWIDSKIASGNYSNVARNIYPNKGDPVRKFRQKRNAGEPWELEDVCLLANYFQTEPRDLLAEVQGVYALLYPKKDKKTKL